LIIQRELSKAVLKRALKGHGFSRAEIVPHRNWGFSPGGAGAQGFSPALRIEMELGL
jgi:hypothetical protein